jgi:hypothetical protein
LVDFLVFLNDYRATHPVDNFTHINNRNMQIKVDNGILISSIIAFFRLACFIRGTGGVGWGRAFKFLWDF